MSAKEELRQDLRASEVPAGADVMFSPHEPEFADCFARVKVKNFDDLKTLGCVPRGLARRYGARLPTTTTRPTRWRTPCLLTTLR